MTRRAPASATARIDSREMLDRPAPHVRVVADEAESADERRCHRSLEALGVRGAADGGRLELGRSEERHLDAVEPVRFNLREQVKMRWAELRGPDERVDAVFHVLIVTVYLTARECGEQ